MSPGPRRTAFRRGAGRRLVEIFTNEEATMAGRERRRTKEAFPEGARVGWSALSCALLATLLASASLAGQEGEEQRYGPSEVLDCEFDFAVLAPASAWGELETVRRCPEPEGGTARSFARYPILEARHVDSVAVETSDADRRRVVVLWTGRGSRKIFTYWDHSPPDRVGIVVDGEVVAEFGLADGDVTDGAVVADDLSPERAERFADRVRTLVRRAGE